MAALWEKRGESGWENEDDKAKYAALGETFEGLEEEHKDLDKMEQRHALLSESTGIPGGGLQDSDGDDPNGAAEEQGAGSASPERLYFRP